MVLATPLNGFSPRYEIVHIPGGNFAPAKDALYTNINLRKLGCGGRTALSLAEPGQVSSVALHSSLTGSSDQKRPERKMPRLLQAHERSDTAGLPNRTAQPDQGSPGRSGDLQHGTSELGCKYRNSARARWFKSVRPGSFPGC